MSADERNVLHSVRGRVPVPEPQAEWVARAIPSCESWVVRPVWHGLFTHATYADPYACFAANRTCRQDLVREPIPYHCRPVQSNTGPVRTDLDAGHPARHGGHADADANADAQPLRGNAASGAGDGDSTGDAVDVRAHHRDAGDAQAVLLDAGPADPKSDTDAATVRDAGAGNEMSQDG